MNGAMTRRFAVIAPVLMAILHLAGAVPGFCQNPLPDRFLCKTANMDNDDFSSLLLQLPVNISRLDVSAPCCDQRNFFSLSQDLRRFSKLKNLRLTQGTIQYFGANLFSEDNEIEHLDISHNIISHMSALGFDKLKNLRYLDLSYNRIGKTGLPSGYFSGLKRLRYLDISNNFIRTIYASTFQGLSGLESLNLGGNPLIQPIEPNIFTHVSNLNILDLSKTGISLLPQATFRLIRGIQNLSLANNKLKVFPHSALLPLATVLISLDLSGNRIRDLPTHIFADWALKSLDLSRNKLRGGIDANSFTGCNITSLSLADNDLSYSDMLAAIKLGPIIESLDISENPLEVIDHSFFRHFKKLQSLNLARSNLYQLPPIHTVFYNTLKSLNLSKNEIEEVESGQFYRMPNLQILDVSNNRIKNLDARHMKFLQSLDLTFLSVNPIQCGCRTFELKEILRTMRSAYAHKSAADAAKALGNVRCASPENVRDQPIIDLPEASIPMCSAIFGAMGLNDKSEISILIIACGAVALVLALIVTVLCSYYLPKFRSREPRLSMSAATSENSDFGSDPKPPGGSTSMKHTSLDSGSLAININSSPANIASLTSTLISGVDPTPASERKAFILDVDL